MSRFDLRASKIHVDGWASKVIRATSAPSSFTGNKIFRRDPTTRQVTETTSLTLAVLTPASTPGIKCAGTLVTGAITLPPPPACEFQYSTTDTT